MVTTEHVAMAQRAAHSYGRRLPGGVDIDDLAQVALIAIWDGLKHFDPAQGVGVEKYLGHRMRFAMQDHLRAGDWMPRQTRALEKKIRSAQRRLEHETGGKVLASQVAAACGLTLDELCTHERDTVFPATDEAVSFGPCDDAEAAEAFDAIDAAYQRLDARSRGVVRSLVADDRQATEVAASLGITVSRVSQLMTAALAKLRAASGI